MGRYVVRLRRTRALQSRFSRFIYRFIFEPGNFRYHLSSPSSLYPLPSLSLSLSLWFFAFAAIGYLSRFKRRGGREEEEEEKKVAVFKERYFAKSVETAVEEEEEEDGDRKVGRSSLPFFQLGSREEGKGCISVSVPTKFRVERYWSGRGKLGNWESPPLPTPLR